MKLITCLFFLTEKPLLNNFKMAKSQQDAALIGNYFSHNSAQGHGTYLSNGFLCLTFLNSLCANRLLFDSLFQM